MSTTPKTQPKITPEVAAQRLYAGQLTSACGAAARGLGEIYVRVHLGAAKVDKVEVLEPAASPALRRCVDKAVRQIAVPADQKAVKITLPIKLGA